MGIAKPQVFIHFRRISRTRFPGEVKMRFLVLHSTDLLWFCPLLAPSFSQLHCIYERDSVDAERECVVVCDVTIILNASFSLHSLSINAMHLAWLVSTNSTPFKFLAHSFSPSNPLLSFHATDAFVVPTQRHQQRKQPHVRFIIICICSFNFCACMFSTVISYYSASEDPASCFLQRLLSKE